MNSYTHALILISDKKDGIPLLSQAAELAQSLRLKITLAHISDDYRQLNYVSDSLMDEVVSEEVAKARALLNELAGMISGRVDTLELVTMRRFADLSQCITDLGIDLVIAGHRNRFMGALTSRSAEYINHLTVDVLIKHIPN
ncbi:universal stress protein [Erwinia sp. OLTSP20]|uniref:universal stress protein n=1 Tax=unclassified Erwinia TaxID=2622719 RepID=UPI000C1764AD|nr:MULTISPECIES: universal stress protein [unclassified Erwinia]PIJ49641.1 universal stress protein [Erwinia sp. OAMSP11]PIJ70056.1 universal stress protein [Erwinia sp. OLSSP12]PIJ80553.1 universal stress protein [Erwinia sp. OLCASP19]PIJ82718.1 universal stress protein [Erwinia sp. OLMTSP26]PIJ84795.1 universal stress protein [Erwinia sp. OLMDSP33]